MIKRVNISMEEETFKELKSFCDARGFMLSQFLVQQGLEAVNAFYLTDSIKALLRMSWADNVPEEQTKAVLELCNSIQKRVLM